MTHALALGRGLTADEPRHGLLHVQLDEFRGLLLGVAADLADHDDPLRLGIFLEQPQHVDELHALHGVAADADARRLTEAELSELVNRLVGQRAAARDDADRALLVDVAGHDADLALVRRDDPGQFGPTSRVFLPSMARLTPTMSATGIPSVMQTTRSTPASTASRMASAANGGGT